MPHKLGSSCKHPGLLTHGCGVVVELPVVVQDALDLKPNVCENVWAEQSPNFATTTNSDKSLGFEKFPNDVSDAVGTTSRHVAISTHMALLS